MEENSDTTVIAVSNKKGGVGKTTVTAHSGAALHQRGHDVLLIDGDPQASLSNHLTIDKETLKHFVERGDFQTKDKYFPVNQRGEANDYWIDLRKGLPNVYEAFYNRRGVDNLGLRLMANDQREYEDYADMRGFETGPIDETIIAGTTDGPDIVPAHAEMQNIGKTLASERDGVDRLGQFIREIDHDYDYILIDTPANVDVMKDGAIIAAKKLIIPAQAEVQSIKATRQHIQGAVEQLEDTTYVDGSVDVISILLNKVQNDGEAKNVSNVVRKQIPDRYWYQVDGGRPDGFDPEDLPDVFWRGRVRDDDNNLLDGVPEELADFWKFIGCRPIITQKRDYTDKVAPFDISKRVAIGRAAGQNRTLFSHDEDCDQQKHFEHLAKIIERRTTSDEQQ